MRLSLCRKRARLEVEPLYQEEHVTETDKARWLLSNLRLPIICNIATVARSYGDEQR